MATNVKVNPRIFNAIKRLQMGGAPVSEAAEYMMITANVAGRIYAAETWEEYQAATYESMNKARAAKEQKKEAQKVECKPQEVRHTVEVQATHYMMQELQKQTKMLELISNKMAAIVEALL